jgi:hypothetical protein
MLHLCCGHYAELFCTVHGLRFAEGLPLLKTFTLCADLLADSYKSVRRVNVATVTHAQPTTSLLGEVKRILKGLRQYAICLLTVLFCNNGSSMTNRILKKRRSE